LLNSAVRKQLNPTSGFTLVEIMIVVAVIGILGSVAFPFFAKARERTRKNMCLENLTQIETAKQQWALDNNKGEGALPNRTDLIGLTGYIHRLPECPAGGRYDFQAIGTPATCTIHGPAF
jgi:prepilin-type N-terminal cleavage/methylation domain-containing protein